MQTYLTRTYLLTVDDEPLIVAHQDAITLHHQGWMGMPEGFSIHFLPAHLPVLHALIAALDALGSGSPGAALSRTPCDLEL